MKTKTLIALAATLTFTAACTTTDPFTGQQQTDRKSVV